MTFEKAHSIYCIGIGGIGVSAIARYALMNGKQVAGSDSAGSTITDMVASLGIDVAIGDKGLSDIPQECDLVVYSRAVPEDHPLRQQATNRGIAQMSYPQVLGEIAQTHTTIAIAGAHGKSTTTALLGLVAHAAGLDPLVIVGTLVPAYEWRTNDDDGRRRSPAPVQGEGRGEVGGAKESEYVVGSNLLPGKGEYFIIEACEFSGHFQTLAPDYLIITNIDADHLDFFKTQENIDSAFYEFAKKTKKKVIACGDDVGCRRVLGDLKNIIWYGGEDGGVETGLTLSLQIPGDHNVLNALGGIATARELEIDDKIIKQVLESFTGTWRRFELVGYYTSPLRQLADSPMLGEGGGIPSPLQGEGRVGYSIPVISDYAHHPKEITATIQAAREKYPDKKIFVVFQPHLRHRTIALKQGFIESLVLADKVIVCEIYDVAGREHGEDISSKQIVDAIPGAIYAKDVQEAEQIICDTIHQNDVLIIMGAGDIDDLARRIILL